MSLILDALRRAERARDKDLTRRISESGAPSLRPRHRSWLPVMLAVTVVILVATVLWVSDEPDPVPATVAEPLPAQQPVTIARGSSLAEISVPEPEPLPATAVPRATTPMFAELSATQRASIPSISIDAHFWSADPARRFVMLNMARFSAGDLVRPGLRVVEIHADSVEFDWQGTRFRLPAR
jgi:hypothetical protein